MDNKELLSRVKEDDVKFISLQFTDVTGSVKSVDITPQVQESDMRLVLDPATYAVLPWNPKDLQRARVFCDIYKPDGKPFEGDPRGALKRMLSTFLFIQKERRRRYASGPL